MQICILPQTDNHASTPQLSFLQARCLSCCPTNSVKALRALSSINRYFIIHTIISKYLWEYGAAMVRHLNVLLRFLQLIAWDALSPTGSGTCLASLINLNKWLWRLIKFHYLFTNWISKAAYTLSLLEGIPCDVTTGDSHRKYSNEVYLGGNPLWRHYMCFPIYGRAM